MSDTRLELRRAAVTSTVLLVSLASGLVLRELAGLGPEIPVLAVVLALTLSRVRHTTLRAAALAAVEVGAVGVLATWVGRMVHEDWWMGGPLLVVGLSVGILARRCPAPVRHAGRLIGLPFLALLITPAAPDAGATAPWWAAVVGVLAVVWTTVAQRLVPSAAPPPAAAAPPAASRRRLDAPTRMALQMAAGLTVALIAGHLLLGSGWTWALLSAYLVASGNRGRGDVVLKAGLRVTGALAGTAVATVVADTVPPGHRSTLVVLFLTLGAGLVLRARNYAWWAATVTAVVALLHAYYGQSGTGLLAERLLGVVLGAGVGVAAAWWVTPVRTVDVVRRRLFDCLAALTDDLTDDRARHHGARPPALPDAVRRLDELAPTVRAHRRTVGRRHDAHVTDAFAAVHHLDVLPTDPDERTALRTAAIWVRRSAAGRDPGDPPPLPADLATVHRVLVASGRPGR